MYRTRQGRAWLGLGLMLGVAGCADNGTLAPEAVEPQFVLENQVREVTVCKTGPAGTYGDFAVSMAGGLPGDLLLTAFRLNTTGTEVADAVCELVWRGETDATLTITETPGPGTELNQVFVNNVEQIPLSHTVSVSVGPGSGAFVIFKNVEGTTPPPTGICDGGVNRLVVRYIGATALAGEVRGQRVGPGTGPIIGAQVTGSGASARYTFATTEVGGLFTSVSGGRLANEFRLHIGTTAAGQVHTSCSQPIHPGLQIGTLFEITEVSSVKGGNIGAP